VRCSYADLPGEQRSCSSRRSVRNSNESSEPGNWPRAPQLRPVPGGARHVSVLAVNCCLHHSRRPKEGLRRPCRSPQDAVLRFARKALWSVIEQMTNPLAQFLLAPVLLRRLGEQQFGLLILALSALLGSQLISAGVSVTLISEVSANRARGRQVALAATIRSALGLLAVGAFVACVLCAAAVTVIAFCGFNKAPADSHATLLVVVSVVLVIVTELDNVYSAILKGFERFDLSAKLEAAARAIWVMAVIIVSAQVATALAVILAAVAVVTAKIATKAVVAQRAVGPFPLWPPRFDRRELTRLGRGGLWQVLQTSASFTYMSLDRWIIGGTLGLRQLAAYGICLQLAQLCQSIPSAAFQVLIPWSSRRATHANNHLDVRKGLTVALAAAMASIALSLVMVLFSRELLTVWISKSFSADNGSLAIVLIFSLSVLSVSAAPFSMLLGFGQWRFSGLLCAIAALAYIGALLAWKPKSLQEFAYARLIYGGIVLFLWYRLYFTLRRNAGGIE